MNELVNYMGYQWLSTEDGLLTIGINEAGLEELTEITKVNLPAMDEEIIPDEICGEIETDSGALNIYCPIEGNVVEINEAVIEDPSLIVEDPLGDGWLFKVEPKNASDLEELGSGRKDDRDDEDEDEDEDVED